MTTGEIVVAVVQSVAAIATFALAFIAWRQVVAARDQVDAAIGTATATEVLATEAHRERVDSQAPIVIAMMEQPQWPPLVDATRSGMPGANELRLLAMPSIHSSSVDRREFLFDRDRSHFMWFRIRGVLSNEGKTTARVQLSGEAQFLEDSSPLIGNSGSLPLPVLVGTPDRGEYLLRPGQSALFEMAAGHTLGEWADAFEHPDPPNPNGSMYFSVGVVDYLASGVVDRLYIEVGGRPIIPTSGIQSGWRLTDESPMGMTVYPVERHYRREGAALAPPPWVQP